MDKPTWRAETLLLPPLVIFVITIKNFKKVNCLWKLKPSSSESGTVLTFFPMDKLQRLGSMHVTAVIKMFHTNELRMQFYFKHELPWLEPSPCELAMGFDSSQRLHKEMRVYLGYNQNDIAFVAHATEI